jgi:hypothetical protein
MDRLRRGGGSGIDRVRDLRARPIQTREQVCERSEVGRSASPVEPPALTEPTQMNDLQLVHPCTIERSLGAILTAHRASSVGH